MNPQTIFEEARAQLIRELSVLQVDLEPEPKLFAAASCRVASLLLSISTLHEKNFALEAEIILRSAMETLFWSGAIVRRPEFFQLVRRDEAHNRHVLAKQIVESLSEQLGYCPDDLILVRETSNMSKVERRRLTPKEVADLADLQEVYQIYCLLSTQAAHPSALSLRRHFALNPSGVLLHLQLELNDTDWGRIFQYGCLVSCQAAELIGEFRNLKLEWPAELMRQCDSSIGSRAI
ncbi:hypothetical protein DK847_14675 [Aestuariivirga litoralis]|uniref:Uncharacterized protein n=1 Tax=Aestuariivirga litoralis TaxID=2650924 RepID=A0A2W2BSJ2_9HYPH|nr:hypothetical protein DK847_14675 [Aestuariivirga litoralis]